MINPEYPLVGLYQKTAIEAKWLSVNWAAAFPTETVSASDWVVLSGGLTVVTSALDGKIARALIGAGTTGMVAYVENRITLNTGEIRVARFAFEIKA